MGVCKKKPSFSVTTLGGLPGHYFTPPPLAGTLLWGAYRDIAEVPFLDRNLGLKKQNFGISLVSFGNHFGRALGSLWDHFRDRAIGGKATWKLTGTLQNPYRDIAVDPAQDET